MLSSKPDFLVTQIRAVLDLSWEKRRLSANGRPFHALSVRIDGHTEFYHNEEHFTAQKGDILFMPRQYDYVQDALRAERIICVHFDAVEKAELHPFVYHPVHPQAFIHLFSELIRLWNEKSAGYEYAALSVFNRILELTISEKRDEAPPEQTACRRAAAILKRDFAEPDLTVRALAEAVGVSETCLRKQFCAEFGTSPKRYWSRLRLEYARQLLQSGYCTVQETAVRCGFPNAKNFSTFIKKESGMTPSELKTACQHGEIPF